MSKLGKDLIEGMESAKRYLEGKKGETRKHFMSVPETVNVGGTSEGLSETNRSVDKENLNRSLSSGYLKTS